VELFTGLCRKCYKKTKEKALSCNCWTAHLFIRLPTRICNKFLLLNHKVNIIHTENLVIIANNLKNFKIFITLNMYAKMGTVIYIYLQSRKTVCQNFVCRNVYKEYILNNLLAICSSDFSII
jgi:hypothetical protein